MDCPHWLQDLMDLLDLDPVERADWVRHCNQDKRWRPTPKDYLKQVEGGAKDKSEIKGHNLDRPDEPDLGAYLISLGLLSEREVMQAKAMEMGIGFVDLERVNIEDSAIQLANRKLVTTHGAIPVKKDGSTVWLAVSEPHNTEVAEVFRIETECRIILVLATQSEIQRAIDRYYPIGG